MCCKDEQGRDKVPIPLAVGHHTTDSDRIEFVPLAEHYLSHAEMARRFKEWMSNTVSGGFYDALIRELNGESKGE